MKTFGFALVSILLIFAIGCSNPQSSSRNDSGPESRQQNQPQPVTRPAIVGVAHIGLRTDNLAAARKFYSGVLGFQEPFTVDDPPGKLLLTYFKVNDHQYVEVFPELKDPKQDRLSHISFETTDAEQMRAYLASRGVKVPEKLEPMLDGNRGFDVTDPDGHDVEFVQFLPGSLHSRNFGKFLPETRISERIIHVGCSLGEGRLPDCPQTWAQTRETANRARWEVAVEPLRPELHSGGTDGTRPGPGALLLTVCEIAAGEQNSPPGGPAGLPACPEMPAGRPVWRIRRLA